MNSTNDYLLFLFCVGFDIGVRRLRTINRGWNEPPQCLSPSFLICSGTVFLQLLLDLPSFPFSFLLSLLKSLLHLSPCLSELSLSPHKISSLIPSAPFPIILYLLWPSVFPLFLILDLSAVLFSPLLSLTSFLKPLPSPQSLPLRAFLQSP